MNVVGRRKVVLAGLAGAGIALGGRRAWAAYPDHPIVAVVPFAAGSSNDTLARIVTPHLSEALGQPVLVENKPGADGIIGVTAVARAQPDGHTLLFSAAAVSLAPALHKSVPYDPARQIAPVAQLGLSPYYLAVSAKLGVRSVAELLAKLRAAPGDLNLPASGNTARMYAELFRLRTNTQFSIVPYNGTGAAITSLTSGETQFALLDSIAFKSVVHSDRVRILAVIGQKRLAALPDVVASGETALGDYDASAWFGVFATGGTPHDILERLNAEVNRITALPDVAKAFAGLGIEPTPNSLAHFDARYRAELVDWKDVVARAHIEVSE